MVLWCDGGLRGVSGVGGGGIDEPMQSGAGSWMRAIGVPYPVNEDRTIYAKGGDFSVVALLVALMGGGGASEYVARWIWRGMERAVQEGRRGVGLLRGVLGRRGDEEELLG